MKGKDFLRALQAVGTKMTYFLFWSTGVNQRTDWGQIWQGVVDVLQTFDAFAYGK